MQFYSDNLFDSVFPNPDNIKSSATVDRDFLLVTTSTSTIIYQ